MLSNSLLVGTKDGYIAEYTLGDFSQLGMSEVNMAMDSMRVSNGLENLLLLGDSSSFKSKLWRITTSDTPPLAAPQSSRRGFAFEPLLELAGASPEFNRSNDLVATVAAKNAFIYSSDTGTQLRRLEANKSSEDTGNAWVQRNDNASFSPDEHLVLYDCCLWDLRSGRQVHRFDRLSKHSRGVFVPTGLELIINSEVWDMRTLKLLYSVPLLNQVHLS